MSPDEDDTAQYQALEKEMAQPDPELPTVFGVDESHTPEPERPAPEQYDGRRHGEPEPQRQPPQPQPEYQQAPPQDYQQQVPPSPDDDPIGYFQAKLQASEARQANLEGHLHHKEFWNTIEQSENQARAEVGEDYDRATEYLKANRMAELETQFPDRSRESQILAARHGFNSPAALRAEILRRDAMTVGAHALAHGIAPASAYHQLAVERGFKPKVTVGRTQEKLVVDALENAPDDTAEKAWAWYQARMLAAEQS